MNRARQRVRISIGAAALLLVIMAPAARAQERPLPAVAKEKAGAKAARVFTDKDVGSTRASQAAPDGKSAASGKAMPAQEQVRITVPELLQEGTIEEARKILDSLKHDEEVLIRRYRQIRQKLASEADPHLRQLYSGSLSRREETLARKRKQIEEVERAIQLAERGGTRRRRSEDETNTK